MLKRKMTVLMLAGVLSMAPVVSAESRLDTPVSLADQIAVANILVLGELQSAIAEHKIKLNVSGDGDAQRTFQDVPVKVLQEFKSVESSKEEGRIIADEFLLRIVQSEGSPFFDSLAFPADPGRQVIMALQPDTLVKDGKPAFVVQQQAFFTVEDDTVSVLHDGKIIDKRSLEEFQILVELDRERIKEALAGAEPAEIAAQMPVAEFEELPEK